MNRNRVWATLPENVYEYFFRRVLASEHRAKQQLTREFYAKLYEECQRRELPAVWSVDNVQSVQAIMRRLNFNEPH